MSKDKRKITRKRFCRLMAAKSGLQVQEIRDVVRRAIVQPELREQERQQTEKHRKETTACSTCTACMTQRPGSWPTKARRDSW